MYIYIYIYIYIYTQIRKSAAQGELETSLQSHKEKRAVVLYVVTIFIYVSIFV